MASFVGDRALFGFLVALGQCGRIVEDLSVMLSMLRGSVAKEGVDVGDISLSVGVSFHDEYTLGGEEKPHVS